MSQDAVERLLGRLITDEEFRRCVSGGCLDRICRQEGYNLTKGELRLAVLLDLTVLDSLASQLDHGLLRAPINRLHSTRGCGCYPDTEHCPLLTTENNDGNKEGIHGELSENQADSTKGSGE